MTTPTLRNRLERYVAHVRRMADEMRATKLKCDSPGARMAWDSVAWKFDAVANDLERILAPTRRYSYHPKTVKFLKRLDAFERKSAKVNLKVG